MKARIVIGANYGDEGKGTVVASYTSRGNNVLNVLTNGGAQRAHSILTDKGNITFQHFGSGTYHGADNYYSRFFILNPMQFVQEYEELIVKPTHIFRDKRCRWTTPYDSMANIISEEQQKRHCSCGMGIWMTIKRYHEMPVMTIDAFVAMPVNEQLAFLNNVKNYYERTLTIPDNWKSIWNSPNIPLHFISDCAFMHQHTVVCELKELTYEEMIFENGQGLLLCDTGKDTPDTTPSNTGIRYALDLLSGIDTDDITAHYVTRPYLTRHGDGHLTDEAKRITIASTIEEDRTNHYNDHQGDFRYGHLDINALHDRIAADAGLVKVELEVTHCDEMDRVGEFKKFFPTVHVYDSPVVPSNNLKFPTFM